jgi:hypothetical protein
VKDGGSLYRNTGGLSRISHMKKPNTWDQFAPYHGIVLDFDTLLLISFVLISKHTHFGQPIKIQTTMTTKTTTKMKTTTKTTAKTTTAALTWFLR